jgi:hypothetical protein
MRRLLTTSIQAANNIKVHAFDQILKAYSTDEDRPLRSMTRYLGDIPGSFCLWQIRCKAVIGGGPSRRQLRHDRAATDPTTTQVPRQP